MTALTRDEARAVLAWLALCQGYRDRALLRMGGRESVAAEEVAAFEAEHPETRAGLAKLAEVAK